MNLVVPSLQNVKIFYLMLRSFIKIFSLLVLVIFFSGSKAQELKLFEETESNSVNGAMTAPELCEGIKMAVLLLAQNSL